MSDRPSRPSSFIVTGDECVAALCRIGFVPLRREPQWTILERGRSLVVVPDVPMLSMVVLDAILQDTGLSYDSFFRLLEDQPTTPALFALAEE